VSTGPAAMTSSGCGSVSMGSLKKYVSGCSAAMSHFCLARGVGRVALSGRFQPQASAVRVFFQNRLWSGSGAVLSGRFPAFLRIWESLCSHGSGFLFSLRAGNVSSRLTVRVSAASKA
jgi:hypothetical protein